MKENLLVSRCLLGENVRYDGGNCLLKSESSQEIQRKFNIIGLCPEVSAGMTIPRIPIELCDGEVLDQNGLNVTSQFDPVLQDIEILVKTEGIKYALMKDFSPSCGSENIYDGTFTGTTKKGEGLVSSFLRSLGVEVFHEQNIEHLLKKLS